MEESAVADRAKGLWSQIVSSKGHAVPFLVIAANLALGVYVNRVILQDFPNSADEYSYIISAECFAEFRLSVPSPELPEFFDFIHVVNDGRFYGKYPPGWPFLLAGGLRAGAPWGVNLILSSLTLMAFYVIARRFFSQEVANLTMILSLGNPFIVFNSASYFSHTACLFFVTLFLGGVLAWLRDPSSKWASLLMGASIGAAFLIRPFTAVILLALTGAFLAYRSWKEGRLRSLVPCLFWGAIPGAAFLGLHFLYNYAQTGSALVSPFEVYDPTDQPNLSGSLESLLARRVGHNLLLRLLDLTLWVPLAPFFLVLWAVRKNLRADYPATLLAVFPPALIVAYVFYRGTGGNQYGPRYLFEATFALILVAACAIRGFGRAGALMVAGVFLLGLSTFLSAARFHSDQIDERMKVYEFARRQRLSDAVVFLKTGSGTMPVGDLTRNGIHFDGPVLYVRDLGSRNSEFHQRYPGRKAYFFEFDRSTQTGRLWPSFTKE